MPGWDGTGTEYSGPTVSLYRGTAQTAKRALYKLGYLCGTMTVSDSSQLLFSSLNQQFDLVPNFSYFTTLLSIVKITYQNALPQSAIFSSVVCRISRGSEYWPSIITYPLL